MKGGYRRRLLVDQAADYPFAIIPLLEVAEIGSPLSFYPLIGAECGGYPNFIFLAHAIDVVAMLAKFRS